LLDVSSSHERTRSKRNAMSGGGMYQLHCWSDLFFSHSSESCAVSILRFGKIIGAQAMKNRFVSLRQCSD